MSDALIGTIAVILMAWILAYYGWRRPDRPFSARARASREATRALLSTPRDRERGREDDPGRGPDPDR